MRGETVISHEFVDFIPEVLEDYKIYISIPHSTALHKCFCGCGNEVVTPISPVWWTVCFDGTSISLDPSVGSWQLPCKSHYWITRSRVEWAPMWSGQRIKAQRTSDKALRNDYFNVGSNSLGSDRDASKFATTLSVWGKLRRLLGLR